MSITLYGEYKDVVHVNVERNGTMLIISKDQLVEGAVFGLRSREPLVLRLWVEKGKIMVLHVFGKDVAWPQNVYEFPLEITEITRPIKVTPLHVYLSEGHGIPELPERL